MLMLMPWTMTHNAAKSDTVHVKIPSVAHTWIKLASLPSLTMLNIRNKAKVFASRKHRESILDQIVIKSDH